MDEGGKTTAKNRQMEGNAERLKELRRIWGDYTEKEILCTCRMLETS